MPDFVWMKIGMNRRGVRVRSCFAGHDRSGESSLIGFAPIFALGFGCRSGPVGGVGYELLADDFNNFFFGVVDYVSEFLSRLFSVDGPLGHLEIL